MRFVKVLLVTTILVATTSYAAPTSPTSQPAELVVVSELKFDGREGILIPVKVDGKEDFFQLDTGAGISDLDKSSFPDLQPVQNDYPIYSPKGRINATVYRPMGLEDCAIRVCNNRC